MNRKTLIGLILIGAILLLWPTYLDVVFPEENPPVSPEKKLVVSSKEKEILVVSTEKILSPDKVLLKYKLLFFLLLLAIKMGGLFLLLV